MGYAFRSTSGRFSRIVAIAADDPLRGAISAYGRYHHDGQRALYLSPDPDWAWKAVASYVRPGDPPRRAIEVDVGEARVVDIRDRGLCRSLCIDPGDSDVPWRSELAAGTRPATWRVSDRSRAAEADGLIYTARTAPERWHLVLFRWNAPGDPAVVAVDQRGSEDVRSI